MCLRTNFLAERDYIHGYEKALRDALGWFQKHSDAMRVFKMYNQNGVELILKGMSENAEKMYELGSDIEFRINDEQVGKKIIHKSIEVCEK